MGRCFSGIETYPDMCRALLKMLLRLRRDKRPLFEDMGGMFQVSTEAEVGSRLEFPSKDLPP